MVKRPTAEPRAAMIVAIRWPMLKEPKEIYGIRPNERRKPNRKPKKCAQLSNHGMSPRRNRNRIGASIFRTARQGRAYMPRFWITSTSRHAAMPNCEPDGPA